MDMLNKLKSTVTTTVSQLSGVLPGNPVTREYEVGKQIGSAGPDLLWKIYAGHKKSTKQEAAIFVLEKKLLDRYVKRDNKEQLIEVLRKGIAQLTRLRHPQILTVQHALEESRESLAFATEPVFSSLANVLGHHDNISPVPQQLKDYKLFEVEIKFGLQQLTEGLVFLHNDVKLLHGNICPESVIINQQGAFKIFGFDFCTTTQETGTKLWSVREPEPDLPSVVLPNLDYLAPEYGRNSRRLGSGGNTITCTSAADMYSLGCLINSIYQGGKSPWQMDGHVESFYRHAASHAQSLQRLDGVPAELVEHVRWLLHPNAEQRPDAHQFVKIAWFDDVSVKTLNYLDSLFQWDNLQKSQFFKGLPQILPRLPERVCLHRVMPCLSKEMVNPTMVPFILPCALHIAQEASKENYVSHILPHLKPAMKIQEPVQVLLIFMQRMELLLQKTPADDVKSDVLPMIYRALDAEAAPQIQELCLSVIPSFASLIDYPAMKNALMPRIKKLCLLPSSQLSVRVNCLLCIGKLLDHVDKWLALDDILPMLPTIPSKDPAVIMATLGVYKTTLHHPRLGIPKEVIATQIVPFLFPLLVEPGLSLVQFRSVSALIKDMMTRVEEEQKTKLESVAALQQEQRTALGNLSLDGSGGGGGGGGSSSKTGTAPATSNPAVTHQIDALFAQLGEQTKSTPVAAPAVPAAAAAAAAPPMATARNTQAPVTLTPSSANKPVGPMKLHSPMGDTVSSMIQSNLSAMGGVGGVPQRPPANNHWMQSPTGMNAGFAAATAAAAPQTWTMSAVPVQRMPVMQPFGQPMLPFAQPLPAAFQSQQPVRLLARADIDDLLS